MITATFNGEPALQVSGGSLRGETDDRRSHLLVRLERQGKVIWEAGPFDIGPDATLAGSTSNTADYLALLWPLVAGVVILGDPLALVLDTEKGKLLASFSTVFAGKSSVEHAALQLSPDEQLLLITSTQRVWVVDRQLEPLLRYDPRFLLVARPRLEGRRLVVDEYDFDSPSEVVQEIIEF